MKKDYFDSLVKSFGLLNQFILPVSDNKYKEIKRNIEEELNENDSKDSRGLLDFFISKLSQ